MRQIVRCEGGPPSFFSADRRPHCCVAQPTIAPTQLPGSMIARACSPCCNATMIPARIAPTTRPKMIPAGVDCTFRANQPAAHPAIIPLIVEPMIIPTIPARTSGVNHAGPPSSAPRIAPSKRPSVILFITSPPQAYSTSARNPLTMRKQKNDDAHDEIRGDNCDQRAVVIEPAQLHVQSGLGICKDRLSVEKSQ